MLTIDGFVIPQLGHVSMALATTMVPVFDKLDEVHLEQELDQVELVLDKAGNKITSFDSSKISIKESQKTPLQGAQLRELGSYLENIDNTNSLGNLYRTVTDDGHVRWVCLQHYNSTSFNSNIYEYIRQFEAFGGKFNKETSEGFVTKTTLTTKNIEQLCDGL